MQLVNVVHRTWWKDNPEYPGGLEPQIGRKTYIVKGVTEEEAREMCKQYNETHEAGRYSRKAEFEKN